MNFKILPILILFLINGLVYAQEDTQSELVEDIPNETVDIQVETVEDITSEPVDLQLQYMLRELENATLQELQELAIQAGISDQGTIQSLKNKLIQHYHLNQPVETPEPVNTVDTSEAPEETQESALVITIESASSSRSVDVEEKDGQEIILTGDVVLKIVDEGTGQQHEIYADKIVFSRINDRVTASGNVRYIRNQNGNAETFLGDSLTFQLKGWKGIIFHGLSEKEEEREEGNITFFFKGDEFRSQGEDILVMTGATITSGNPEQPTYRIRARKIWILGPQEWGMLNAVLYIGRVPLLYMPFYYRPGNEMIFNPVMGYREREGALIQTTTYLLGRKQDEDLSFFNAGLISDDQYNLEREGLYLFKTDKTQTTETETDFVKIMLDYYTRLGYYGGVVGSNKVDDFQLDYRFGAGYSRSIDADNNIYFNDEGDQWETRNNESYFYGLELPFRWEVEFDIEWKKLNLKLEYLSDAAFRRDFHNRAENFDWLNWLLEERTRTDDTEDTLVSSLDSEISLDSHSFDTSTVTPWINQLSITKLSVQLNFNQAIDGTLEGLDQYHPGVYFFYPSSISPRITLSMGGQFWNRNFPKNIDVTQTREEGQPLSIVPPDSLEQEEAEEDIEFIVDPRGTRAVGQNNWASTSFTWNLYPTFTFDTPYKSDDWTSAQDINWNLDYSKRKSYFNGFGTWKVNLADNYIEIYLKDSAIFNNWEYVDLT
ncbi:MAG: hypothetical protein PF447_06265, partial [Spirochaetaceae bacterium]|nr:hypothetical protein [Spirochaetaceae bacterium]